MFRRWRLRYEVEAYREQLRHCHPDSAHAFARVLAQKYRLRISEAEAYRLLTQCPEGSPK